MKDIIVFDDIIPKLTQQRFAEYVMSPDFTWNDYNHILTAGMYFKDVSATSTDVTTVPSDALVKLGYYNDFRKSKVLDETLLWLGIALLDEYSRRTGETVQHIMRIKVNCQGKSRTLGYDENCCNEIHVDSFDEHKTLVYYINDSDGDTFLFDQVWKKGTRDYDSKVISRVNPKQGRAVCFNGLRFHAPSNPVYHPRRYIMNINFI